MIFFKNSIFYSDLFQINRFICHKSIYLMYIDLNRLIDYEIDLFTKPINRLIDFSIRFKSNHHKSLTWLNMMEGNFYDKLFIIQVNSRNKMKFLSVYII